VRALSVVVGLVLGQDGPQMLLAEHQHPVRLRSVEQDQPAAEPDEDEIQRAEGLG
jgi:hypothetical protein